MNISMDNKRGQVGIFIIIALIIVIGIILAAILIPKFRPSTANVNADNPKVLLNLV